MYRNHQVEWSRVRLQVSGSVKGEVTRLVRFPTAECVRGEPDGIHDATTSVSPEIQMGTDTTAGGVSGISCGESEV